MRDAYRYFLPSLSRRTALRFGVTAAVTGLLPRWRAAAQNRVPDELQVRFLRWSRMATGFADLTAGNARTFMDRTLRSGVTVESLLELDPGAYRGTLLEKRLLEAWYTGIFRIDGASETRSYETTLMWRAAGIAPPPSTCDGGPQRWASVPTNI